MFHLLWEVSLHPALSWPCRACGTLPELPLPTVLFQCSPLILHSPTQRRGQPADSLFLALFVFTLCNYLVIHRIIPHCQRHVSLATDSLFHEKIWRYFNFAVMQGNGSKIVSDLLQSVQETGRVPEIIQCWKLHSTGHIKTTAQELWSEYSCF